MAHDNDEAELPLERVRVSIHPFVYPYSPLPPTHRLDGQDWSKHLFLHDGRLPRHVHKDSGTDDPAVTLTWQM